MIHLDCGEVRTHASWKTNKKWENFNSQGTKMSLLSDKLWLIANNSKSFPNGNISILRSNLGLCKLFIQTYLNLALSSWVFYDLLFLEDSLICSKSFWTLVVWSSRSPKIARPIGSMRVLCAQNLLSTPKYRTRC